MSGFPKVLVVKIGLLVSGLGTFAVGVRVEDSRIRWVGIGLVGAAFLLRFAGPRPGSEPDSQPPEDTR